MKGSRNVVVSEPDFGGFSGYTRVPSISSSSSSSSASVTSMSRAGDHPPVKPTKRMALTMCPACGAASCACIKNLTEEDLVQMGLVSRVLPTSAPGPLAVSLIKELRDTYAHYHTEKSLTVLVKPSGTGGPPDPGPLVEGRDKQPPMWHLPAVHVERCVSTILHEAFAAVTRKMCSPGDCSWQSVWVLPRTTGKMPEGRWVVRSKRGDDGKRVAHGRPALDIVATMQGVCPELTRGDLGSWVVSSARTGIFYRMLRPLITQGFRCTITPSPGFRGPTHVSLAKRTPGPVADTGAEGPQDTETSSDFEDAFQPGEEGYNPFEPSMEGSGERHLPTVTEEATEVLAVYPPRDYVVRMHNRTMDSPFGGVCDPMPTETSMFKGAHSAGAVAMVADAKFLLGTNIMEGKVGPKGVTTADGPCKWEPTMAAMPRDRVVSSPMLTPMEGMALTLVPTGESVAEMQRRAGAAFINVLRTHVRAIPGVSLQLVQNKANLYVVAMFHFNALHYTEAAHRWRDAPDDALDHLPWLAFANRTHEIIANLPIIASAAVVELCNGSITSGAGHLHTELFRWNTIKCDAINKKWAYFTMFNGIYEPAPGPGATAMTWHGRDVGWLRVALPQAPDLAAGEGAVGGVEAELVPVLGNTNKQPHLQEHSFEVDRHHKADTAVVVLINNRGDFSYEKPSLTSEALLAIANGDPMYATNQSGHRSFVIHDANGHVARSPLVIAM